jgi:hypothetical protein
VPRSERDLPEGKIMKRRPAVTLIEALMAIFVMSIGLLALLTLFPLGAVQMAQALKDDRTAQAGIIAVGQFKGFDLGNDALVNTSAFENPWPGSLPALTTGIATSYPVFVDPIGQANGALAPIGNAPFGIRRVTVSRVPQQSAQQPNALPSPQWQQRWFSLQDDLTYADNGIPDLAGLGNPIPASPPSPYIGQNTISREGRYTWAYMVRRQTAMVPSPPPTPGSTPVPPINLAVVVYSARSPGVDIGGNPIGETPLNVTYTAPNLVTIDWTGLQRPALRRGSWVLDARLLPLPAQAASVATGNVPQGYFYRVVSVNDVTSTVMEVEIQRSLGGTLRGPSGQIPASNPPQFYTGLLVVMDNVSEVFEKDTGY